MARHHFQLNHKRSPKIKNTRSDTYFIIKHGGLAAGGKVVCVGQGICFILKLYKTDGKKEEEKDSIYAERGERRGHCNKSK
jgi:hypothetical protein